MHLKNLCNNFFIREQQEWGSSMREDEPGAQGDQHRGRGPAQDFPQQGTVPQCLSRAGCWQLVPISSPVTIRQCEMNSWIQGPSRKFSQKQQETGLGVRLWSCGLLQEVHSAIQDKRRWDCAQPCTQYSSDLPELQWNSWTGGQSGDRSLRKGCWGHPAPRYSSQKEGNIS